VMAVSFGSTLRRQRPGSTVEDLDLWRHSLLTALAAPKVLSKTTTLDAEPSIAYTTGLVHDIGKLLISCVVDRATRAAAAKLIVDGTHSSVEAERATLGTDHCEVGALLLERWQLPDVIVEAVARHHDPNLDPKPTLAAVVCVADAAAHEAQIPTDGETFNRLAVPPVLEALRLGPEKTAALIAYANDQLDKVNRFSRLG
jgi:putative nucleotidyltransferase with HDIG domain